MSIRAEQKRTFREAIRNLSGYYGVKDANSFMSILLASATDSKVTASSLESAVDFAQEGTLDELSDVLLATSGDGLYIDEIIKKIDEYCIGNPDDPVAKGFTTNPIQGEPLISVTTLDGVFEGEDYKRATNVKEILGTDSELTNAQGNMKSISTIEIHHPNLNFSNRDTAAAAIFLQSLPSIEMSKAVPYFDIKVITRGNPIETDPSDNKKEVFSNGISIYKFLHGENISEGGEKTMKTLIASTPIELASQLPSVGGTAGDTSSDTEEERITVAGMEIFTSPQTMVNGNLTYSDLDTTETNSVPSEQKILDKFRPLLTLTGFDITVAPSVGPLSTESASMKIKLHDKSRLKEIAPLVVPGQLGTVELMIEYGWSHPQSDPKDNPYGALINSMRRRSKWGIVNSTYSFTPTGEVDISLKLITKGAANAAFELISNTGGDRPDASLQKVIKEVREKFRDLKGKGYTMNQEMGAPDVIGKTTSMKGLSSIEPDDWKKIEKFLKNMKSRSKGDSKLHWSGLADKITEAQEKQSSLLDALVSRFKDKMGKCAAVPPIQYKKPFVKKAKKAESSTDSAMQALLDQMSPADEKQKSDSVSASDETILNADGSAKLSEGDGKATPDQPTTIGDAFNVISDAMSNISTREGGNDAISKEIEKQRKEEKPKAKAKERMRTITVYPPFGKLPETQTSDPYLVAKSESLNKISLFQINEKSHVSFGKLLLHFVAEPLANTLKFDEVQLIFYPLNEYSMWARDLNVGQYPVNKARFQEVFYEQLKKSSSMTIQKFINMIARNFFQFQGDDIYGLSSFYGKDEKGKMAIKKKYQKDEKSKIDFTESKQEVLSKCYPDSPIKRFKKPQIKMNIECVPHQTREGESILRLHFFDQAVDSYSSYTQLWQATSASELGIVGKYASSVKKYQSAPPPPEKGSNSKEHKNWDELVKTRQGRVVAYKKHFETAFQTDEEGNVSLGDLSLKKMTIKVPKAGKPGETEEQIVFRIEGGPDQLRGILAKNMPTLKYGTEFSGILNASLSTQSDPSMETINMKRQGVGNIPQGVVDDGLPLTIRPVTLSLDTFGCPFVYFGQQFFVDFQTNTTIDDVYTVTGISHVISQKEFKTNLKLVPLNKLGQYRSMATSLATISAMSTEISEIVDKNKL